MRSVDMRGSIGVRGDKRAECDASTCSHLMNPRPVRARARAASKGPASALLNDLIFDLANRPGFSGWLFKAIGMTGDVPHIPLPVRLKEVKDKQAVSEQLELGEHAQPAAGEHLPLRDHH